jgi:hypothetical protein
MNKLEELRAKIAHLQAEAKELEDAECRAINVPHVGKFYRYCESENWYIYTVITSVNDAGMLCGWSFEINPGAKITVAPNELLYSLDGYKEITAEQFYKAWRKLQKRVAEMGVDNESQP